MSFRFFATTRYAEWFKKLDALKAYWQNLENPIMLPSNFTDDISGLDYSFYEENVNKLSKIADRRKRRAIRNALAVAKSSREISYDEFNNIFTQDPLALPSSTSSSSSSSSSSSIRLDTSSTSTPDICNIKDACQILFSQKADTGNYSCLLCSSSLPSEVRECIINREQHILNKHCDKWRRVYNAAVSKIPNLVKSLSSTKETDRLTACNKLNKRLTSTYTECGISVIKRQLLRQAHAIPNLLQLLSDRYLNTKYVAAIIIGNLAEGSDKARDMILEHNGIQKLVSMLPTRIDPRNYKDKAKGWSDIVWTLGNLAAENHQGIKKAIRECGGIPRLVPLLTIDDKNLRLYGVIAIYRLVFENRANQEELRKAGAIPALVHILSSSWTGSRDNNEIQMCAVSAIEHIAIENMENQNLVREAGAIPEIIRLLALSRTSLQTKEAAVLALGKIADGNKDNQDAIRDAGAVELLVPLLGLDSSMSTLRQYTIWTLGTLAGNNLVNSHKIGDLGGAISVIIDHLNVDNEGTRENAAWALGNLAVNNAENKDRISSSNGIEKLVSLLSDNFEEVRREASIALAYIAEESPVHQAAVREAGAIPVIVKLLADEHEKVIDGAKLALDSFCENCPENVEIVRREGGLPLLEELATTGSSSDIRERAKGAVQACSNEGTAIASSSGDAIDRASSSNTISNDDHGSFDSDCVDSSGIDSSSEGIGAYEYSNSNGSGNGTTHEHSSSSGSSSDHNITSSATTSSAHTSFPDLSAPAASDNNYGESSSP